MDITSVQFGDDEYSGLIQVAVKSDGSPLTASISLSGTANEKMESSLSEEQLSQFLDSLQAIQANEHASQVLFGKHEYSGRLDNFEGQAIVEIAQWAWWDEWHDSSEAIIESEQIPQVLALFNR
jgi:hypothetical protein